MAPVAIGKAQTAGLSPAWGEAGWNVPPWQRHAGVASAVADPDRVLCPQSVWQLDLIVAAPLLLYPQAGSVHDILAVLLTMLLFRLVQAFIITSLAPAEQEAGSKTWLGSVPALLLLQTAGLAVVTAALIAAAGSGPIVMALLLAGLELCGRFWDRRSTVLFGLLTVAAMMIRVEAGIIVVGIDAAANLVGLGAALGGLAAACHAASLMRLRRHERNDRLPSRAQRMIELLGIFCLAGGVAIHADLLLADPRLRQPGGIWVLLALPCFCAALLRYRRLARVRHVARADAARLANDPQFLLALAGWVLILTCSLPLVRP